MKREATGLGEIESTHCKRSQNTPGSLTIELESNNNNKIGIVLSSYLIRYMNGKILSVLSHWENANLAIEVEISDFFGDSVMSCDFFFFWTLSYERMLC